ncbi:hypothetical protein CLAFUW4_07438 [Fulvia fulva]|uniref:uncharacterized protein n=1 Tax=Passalora fulva TaxID=5499 RepID=UPI0004EA0E44|nr:uncharacterized protein CLAFUR5_20240 [Fulvia fulva]KAK4621581.1 hypothetical protein CLAFUR4_07445 [Fulvia fulva]KAK4622733.1 hypothetical protein CLAFUR0_07444 [Fulvia fulva]WMI38946.1 hypothetical protein CLAFUR5_20240 [Fulvia fulva]WPV15839.1 hypothetical protein CLAFUW4_07438 [Fulvia fulva]WPV30710.1 hypothetical protein CLAFUW7_07441 [Fulvia fulva]
MATITDTVKSCFSWFHEFNAYMDRVLGPTHNYSFAFSPNSLLSPHAWVHLLARLCIIIPLAMITVVIIPFAIPMDKITKAKIVGCSHLLLLPLLFYVPKTLFHGIRDPAIRQGTWFHDFECDDVHRWVQYYDMLADGLQTFAVFLGMWGATMSSDVGKKPDEYDEKKLAGDDRLAEKEENEGKEKMKILIISDEGKKNVEAEAI